jgi:Kef-type K+ transport system membrane component KefB/glycine cleavage system regulatory protein
MDVAEVLRDILVVLVAAKVAAEVAERIGVPAVVGEILAGILIGPSLLGWVGADDQVLRTLGEIGVILLLLEVGMEMNLSELGRVGRASFTVAVVGVIAPLVLGTAAMQLLGDDFNTALFIGAALTATSVGITARVFGDLRALATTEARIVLGAAVADDVMGLVVLTVVVRLVTDGSVSAISVLGIIGVAVAFLVIGGVVGLRVAPALFAGIERISRSTGTLIALALAFTLVFAELANAARLAPIVGAFVAGLALGRSRQRDRIGRELAPVGHLFIPVFFLQIGIDVDVTKFFDGRVLFVAGILLVVAIAGKLVSAVGALGTRADRWLIGLGMLPRGEVGLIFATIGLQSGVLDDSLYAAVLLVVLVTTLMAPPLLKLRYRALRHRAMPIRVARPTVPVPAGGWLRVVDDEVRLAANPPPHQALLVAFDAALLLRSAQPSPELLDWLIAVGRPNVQWDKKSTEALLEVAARGNARSWRFLETTGVLDQVLPELAATFRARQTDPFQLDPLSTHRWSVIEELQRVTESEPELSAEYQELAHPEWLLLAALLAEGLADHETPVATTRRIVRRLDLGARAEQEIAGLIEDGELMWSAALRADGLGERSVIRVASHLDTPERARALFLLSVARRGEVDRSDFAALRQLHELIQVALAHSELTGLEVRNLIGRRRVEAIRRVGERPDLIKRIEEAPQAYLLDETLDATARQVALLEPLPGRREARVGIARTGSEVWIEVGARDRPGLLASVTGVLTGIGVDVSEALIATWPDGGALETFRVSGDPSLPAPEHIADEIEQSLDLPLVAVPIAEAVVEFDDDSSPWHTIAEIRAPDQPGLLHALATAITAGGADVQSARISTEGSTAVNRFDLNSPGGGKLSEADKALIRSFVASGGTATQRRWGFTSRRRAEPVGS